MRLGRVTQVSPLRVRLNGDTQDAPAFAGSALPVDTEVVVDTVEGRRFVVYPGGGSGDAATLDGIDSTGFLRKGLEGGSNTDWGVNTANLDAGTLNQNLPSGWYDGSSMTGAPTADWWLVQVLAHSKTSTWQRQIAYAMTGDTGTQRTLSRRCYGTDPTNAASWSAWRPLGDDDAWTTPTMLNGWKHYQGDATTSPDVYGPVQYRKVGNVVTMRGLADGSASTGTQLIALPVGWRPARHYIFTGWSPSGPFEFRVHSGGDVQGYTTAPWASFACSWYAEQ